MTHTEDRKICFISGRVSIFVIIFTKQRQAMPCRTVSAGGVCNVHSEHKIFHIVIITKGYSAFHFRSRLDTVNIVSNKSCIG